MAAPADLRIKALRRFAVAISILTLLGHTLLGFEQAFAHVLIALASTYGVELMLELVDATARRRPAAFRGGLSRCIDFLLPAHITGLACAMLLYPGERLAPTAFAGAFAIASKALFRAPVPEGGARHFLNPSNAGIALTLLVFPWVSIAPPYQFLENLQGAWDWVPPAIIVATGTFLNGRFTKRLPLIAGWLSGFAAQALLRSLLWGSPLAAGFVPLTGMAFVLFTFYMVTDPGTTPSSPRHQVAFGLATAACYGVLQVLHVVFGLFFALAIVCTGRGAWLFVRARLVAIEAAPQGLAPDGTLGIAGK